MDEIDDEQELDVDVQAPKVVMLTNAQAVQLRNNPDFQEAAHEYAESLRVDPPRKMKSGKEAFSRTSTSADQFDDEEDAVLSQRLAKIMDPVDEGSFSPSFPTATKVRKSDRSDKVSAPMGLSKQGGARTGGKAPKSTGKRQLRTVVY